MNQYYEGFFKFLEEENKRGCVEYILPLLETGQVDIVTLYEQVLTPALFNMTCRINEKQYCIWKEHTRTAIVRTIIECCYPYLVKEAETRTEAQQQGNVLVLCPAEEYHEIGARMVADFFTLCGYTSIFIGSNTPREDLLSSLEVLKPKIIAISVTNTYNLVTASKTVMELRSSNFKGFEIVVGGQAFARNPNIYKEIGADRQVTTFSEIEALGREKRL